LIVTLGLLYPVTAVIRGITVEKQLKQKELMKMMSVNEYHIGWSWFISFWIFHLVTSTAMAAVSNGFYPSSGFGYLWFFWILAFTSTIVFGMLIGSIFTKATTATLIGLLLYFSGYFLTLAMDFDTGDTAVLAIISLHPVAAFSYGLQEIGRLEDGGVGVNSNTWNFSNTLSGYTLAGSYRAMFIDCILWGVVTWYLNRVVPSEFGQPKPWNFIFKVSYWCPKALNLNDESDEGELGKAPDVPVEQVGEGLEQSIHEGKGISIRNLRKQFGEKTAVDNLNLTIFSGQVTALLGKAHGL
jgi:ABC-type multidrug transport system fused ATPase/permease subunit